MSVSLAFGSTQEGVVKPRFFSLRVSREGDTIFAKDLMPL